MSDFTTILNNIVASTNTEITTTNQFKNISGNELLDKLRQLPNGNKDGSHFIRTSLKTFNNGQCMSRTDANTHSTADLLVLDCDKHIDNEGFEIEGAPDPLVIHQVLKRMDIGHVLYGSHSHYTGGKGNRYRIILAANQPYSREQLPAII